jgi:integrase
VCRWREDQIDPSTNKVQRVRKWDVLAGKKECPTKKLALKKLADRLRSINSDDYKPTIVGMTFAAFAEKWQKAVMIHHKPSSQDSERTILKQHLLPAFGALPIASINAEMVQAFVNQWDQSPKTLRNVIVLLMGMWDHAKAWGYAEHNPFPRGVNGRLLLRMPEQIKSKTYNFSLEEALAIISKAQGKWKLMFRTLAECGMRPGELAAMRSTDLNGRTITLSQSVYRQHIQTQKTVNSVRQFAISQELAADLAEYIEATKGEKNNYGLVWTNGAGNPIPMNRVLSDVLNPILEELGIRSKLDQLGIKKAGHYAFRHMNATEMRRANVPLKTIQKRLGHAEGSDITDRFYVHSVDSDDLAAADMLGVMLNGNTYARVQ